LKKEGELLILKEMLKADNSRLTSICNLHIIQVVQSLLGVKQKNDAIIEDINKKWHVDDHNQRLY